MNHILTVGSFMAKPSNRHNAKGRESAEGFDLDTAEPVNSTVIGRLLQNVKEKHNTLY